MKKLSLLLVLIGLVFIVYACSGASQSAIENASAIEKTVSDKLGSEYQPLYNQSKTHVLYIQRGNETPANPSPLLKFLLYEIKGGKLLMDESVPAGSVKWLNDTQIEVTWVPGMVTANDAGRTPGYIFDVTTGRKIESSESSIIKQN